MFRTELPLVPAPQQLPLSARMLTMGSCFSDTIGARLADSKVNTLVNPFGTVFNPFSLCKLLRAAAGEETDWQQHIVEARGRWQSYDLHATLGADSPVELLQTLQQRLRDTGTFLATADVVVLTLGTAWAYRLKETDELVSNCHKLPSEKFDKELLTPEEVISAIAETHAYLRLSNPKLRFVLTVSPVRHLKDTLPLNSVSKSVLRVACHYLSELLPDVSYFPAYELLLDDLRDYRFYAPDMLHPSTVAEDYIWERFTRTYFDVEFGRFRKEWDAVRHALNHRPLHAAAPEHRLFLVSILERLERLARQADMRMEILDVRKQIQQLPLPKPQVDSAPEPDEEERVDVTVKPATVLERAIHVREPQPTAETEAKVVEISSEAEDLAETMEEAAHPKKKRRNRGGAKRNKNKNAARLLEEASAAALSSVSAEHQTVEAEVAANELVTEIPSDLSSTPLDFNPDLPLQTVVERRKRASRRGRGRKPADEAVTDTVSSSTDLLAQAAPNSLEADAVAADYADQVSLRQDAQEASDSTGSVEVQSPLRPARTGRSASEVRAAALRKPRRPDSRIKTLYATPSETSPSPAELPLVPALSIGVNDQPEASALESRTAAPVLPVTLTTVVPTSTPIADVVPVVRGTGASGRLSGAGKVTLTVGLAQPRPILPPTHTEANTLSFPESVAISTDVEPQLGSSLVTLSANDEESPISVTVDAPTETIPPKKRRRPAKSSIKKSSTIVVNKQPEDQSKAEGVITGAEKEVQPSAKKAATTSSGPRRRKSAAKPATPASDSVLPAAKRATRPPRRKPASPTSSDTSETS